MATPSLALPFATDLAPAAVKTARATGTRLTVRGLSKHYEGLAALDAVDLDVGAGELVALLGPSGSGKTTLLRVIAGLLQPDAGGVHFDDTDATRLSLRERGVGFVFQHYALFRHMTVAENIAFGLRSRPRSRRPSKGDIARRVQELLALVQLPEHGGRYPEQLSGGQKQRIALARALAIEPRVLLLDEPFGALDAKVRVELRRWLRRLHEQTGQTTLFVTHDQEEALELADRVVLLRDGRIEQVGTPAEIYDTPASAFAFDFIGRASTIDGEVRDGRFGDGHAIAALPTDSAPGRARLYFRPHDAALADAGFAGRVTDIRRLAGVTTLEVALARGGTVEVDVANDVAVPERGAAVHVKPRRYGVFPY
ncbi:sulfate ABC transporter ATP-binding protein [Lysobacter sp. TY2-98]|uniref:sulfate/molybdate ABC transporter ATP-binding protein n=1 Tax=Lysobacter sp. TY2-98 TaxID=2290922 RepID=UPI000E201F5A|nr:sulfate/molybdate ABC transporter ATP-binding protein [Lysobacter sp. TY2-98]AXK73071.1 sulfate ABC transporter ATP-binding protein [Lysobacter sp. TY2-98]